MEESWDGVAHHVMAAAESWKAAFCDSDDLGKDGGLMEDAIAWTLYLARELAAVGGEANHAD